ncbi:MAG: endo-1,4-beta-xylanase [Bacteroidota bacterium]
MINIGKTTTLLWVLVFSLSCSEPVKYNSTLKEAFKEDFLVGAALSAYRVMGKDSMTNILLEQQFNTITPENSMKWERIHPKPGIYNFQVADRFVALGEEKEMHLVAHTLIWHNQTPHWVFMDSEGNLASRDTLLMRMRDHIYTIMGRYKGKIHSWDVVNEAIKDDGSLKESLWYQIIGDDYIEKAFQYAREADPGAHLIYNDFSLASRAKREGTVRLIEQLQSKGIRIDGIGMQGHYDMTYPNLKELEASIVAFSELGVEVMITELDVSVLPWPDLPQGAEVTSRFKYRAELDPYQDGLPDSVQLKLADRYTDLFRIFVKHSDKISRVTFWGVDDGKSWKNNFPVRGRSDYALLFDHNYGPKPAYHAVIRTAQPE